MSNESQPTVEELFRAKDPDLADMLNNTGAYWPSIRDNTITSEELIRELTINTRQDSYCRKAAIAILTLRLDGRLPAPQD